MAGRRRLGNEKQGHGPLAARGNHNETAARRRMRRTVPARHGTPVRVGSRSAFNVAAIAP